jgi:hypothetical protein
MRILVHTVKPSDVGKNYFTDGECSHCGAKGKIVFVVDLCGAFQRGDVGKRIYSVDGILQMENNAQLKARLTKGDR